MAKTKRRQLAALAAKADGKGLTGTEERIASCKEAGPSGALSCTNDPSVEIRTQRVIIKIPALPPKPAAIPSSTKIVRRRKRKASIAVEQSPKLTPKEAVERRKRKSTLNTDLKSDHIPADDVTIRKRRSRTNLKLNPKQVPADDAKIRRRRTSSKLNLSSKDVLGDGVKRGRRKVALDMELNGKEVPADEAKISKVIIKLGKWRREKMIGELRSPVANVPTAGRQSRTKVTSLPPSRKRVKIQQEPNTSPVEDNSKELASRLQDHTSTANGDLSTPLVPLETCSGDIVLSSTNRSVEVASTCDLDGARNRAKSTVTFKRRRGSAASTVVQPPTSPKYAEREETLRNESLHIGLEGSPESRSMHSKKTVNSRQESLGHSHSDDISLVRNVQDGATPSRAEAEFNAEPQVAVSTSTGLHQNLQLPQSEPFSTSHLQDQIIKPVQQTYPPGETEEDFKPLWQVEQLQLPLPFTPGENGVFLVIKKEEEIDIDQAAQCLAGKDVLLSGAELIKQNAQLAIINKRLDAAGGLRKWLLDKGLGQFVPIFDDNKIDNLTLLQITMTGLKEMGMIPVGPRRKLMHALNCLIGRSPLPSVGGLLLR